MQHTLSSHDELSFRSNLEDLRKSLDAAFSRDTAYPGSGADLDPGAPKSTGHCAIVAAIAEQMFGGTIMRTELNGEEHWFNRIDAGTFALDYDLTADQFEGTAIEVAPLGRLYPGAICGSWADLEPEALARGAKLAPRAQLTSISALFTSRLSERLKK